MAAAEPVDSLMPLCDEVVEIVGEADGVGVMVEVGIDTVENMELEISRL
jgi:hypothetical protein